MPSLKFTHYDEVDGEEEITIPARYVVCSRCHGEGTHDCWEGGMTGEEMEEQGPEFFEDYMNGVYSKPCTVCEGKRVELVPDEKRAHYSDLEKYTRQLEADAEIEAIYRMERMAGA
jgi:hypothetical protein